MTDPDITSAAVEPNGTPPDVLRALFVASLKSWACAEEKITRAVAANYQPAAGTTPYRDPATGAPLGSLQRTNPAPEWVVTDAAALREHLMANSANVETTEELDPPDPEDLVALVREHRPEWLRQVPYLRDGVISNALSRAQETGYPDPGITLRRPEGVLRVVPDKGAREVFARMIKSGRLHLDGTTPGVLPARAQPAVTRLPELGLRVSTRDRDRLDDAWDQDPAGFRREPEDPFAEVPTDPFAGVDISHSGETP